MFYNYSINNFYDFFFSKSSREITEKGILIVALTSFFIHLILILMNEYGLFGRNINTELLRSPLIAIYTPFSFILLYEVYLLIYYLPQSFTFYLSKQYEIITLIVFRRFFKDISFINTKDINIAEWLFSEFFLDLAVGLLLFVLVYFFKKNFKRNKNKNMLDENFGLKTFVNQKKIISIILIPVFLFMVASSFVGWFKSFSAINSSITNLNQIFFEDFFSLLIFVDVVILLLSFFYTQDFHKIIRNSGFIVSTIIIRMSFGVTGSLNLLLIVSALLTGLIVLYIHNLYNHLDKRV